MNSSRKSPPHHRHDGSSPLPLGMDASPAPLKWEGANTVWPHDPGSGWSYCVTIPSWVVIPEAKTAEGTFINPTVFYRVLVGIQSPQGISSVCGVLRRFSDFLKLNAALKNMFKKKKIPAAPPKNTLLRMNSSQTLLQERRHALEDWLSALLEDIEISRSAPIAAFLELEAAARSACNAISNTQEEGNSIVVQQESTTISNGREDTNAYLDNASDAGCSTSGIGTPTASEIETEADAESILNENTRNKQHKGKELEEDGFIGRLQHARTASDATLESESILLKRKYSDSDIASLQSVQTSMDGSLALVAGIEQRMEGLPHFDSDFLKGVSVLLPADQRGNVRRVLSALQRRFQIVKADMEDLLTRLNQEVAVKEFLTTKVRDLEGELDNTRRRSQDVLQQAVSLERERVTELQWELEDCRAALLNAEEALQTERDDRASDTERLQTLENELETSKQQIARLEERMETLTKERDTIEAQARAEKRVLAKEIKTLRKSHPELKEDLDAAIRAKSELEEVSRREKEKQEALRTSRATFVHEVSALRQRLHECSVDFLAKEDDKSNNNVSSDAMELLTTSDNRISVLLAEARLMGQEDEETHEDADIIDNEALMRRLMVEILIENAQLRKGMNSLTRSTLLTVQKRDKEAMEEPIISRRSNVLNRFI